MNYEDFVYGLMDTEPAVFGGAVINNKGDIAFQTENWDLAEDKAQLLAAAKEAKIDGKSPGTLVVMKIKYMIVEFTPERVIATNVTRKGHVILAPVDDGALITFIDPNAGPRDALFNVQAAAGKLAGNL